jgi:hypothetical protein
MPLRQRRVRRGPDVAPAPGDTGHCVLRHLSVFPGTPTLTAIGPDSEIATTAHKLDILFHFQLLHSVQFLCCNMFCLSVVAIIMEL